MVRKKSSVGFYIVLILMVVAMFLILAIGNTNSEDTLAPPSIEHTYDILIKIDVPDKPIVHQLRCTDYYNYAEEFFYINHSFYETFPQNNEFYEDEVRGNTKIQKRILFPKIRIKESLDQGQAMKLLGVTTDYTKIVCKTDILPVDQGFQVSQYDNGLVSTKNLYVFRNLEFTCQRDSKMLPFECFADTTYQQSIANQDIPEYMTREIIKEAVRVV